jgi:hypothetical protein
MVNLISIRKKVPVDTPTAILVICGEISEAEDVFV